MKTKDIAAKYDLKQFEIEDYLIIHSASYATKEVPVRYLKKE